jgi:hypothetical protein
LKISNTCARWILCHHPTLRRSSSRWPNLKHYLLQLWHGPPMRQAARSPKTAEAMNSSSWPLYGWQYITMRLHCASQGCAPMLISTRSNVARRVVTMIGTAACPPPSQSHLAALPWGKPLSLRSLCQQSLPPIWTMLDKLKSTGIQLPILVLKTSTCLIGNWNPHNQ